MRRITLAFLFAIAMSSIAMAADEARTIQSSGTASAFVVPDEVEVWVQVRTTDPDLAKAKTLNDAASKEMLEFFKVQKIDDKDIQSQRIQSEREYEQVPDKPREFKGFAVSRDYRILVRDAGNFESITDWLLPKMQYSIERFEFRSSDYRKRLDDVKRQAVRVAREQAGLIAGEMKCAIGEPRAIIDRSSDEGGGGGNLFGGGGGNFGGEAPAVRFGQLELKATVDVTFDLLPQKR